MRGAIGKWIVALGAGVALIAAQEYGRQPASAPVQPMELSLPRVQVDFPGGPLPVENVDVGAMGRIDRAEPLHQVQPIPVQPTDAHPAVVAETQRQQDARLFEEQEAASERQQEQLNLDIERNLKTQEEMQAEPRIQDVPEVPLEAVPVGSTQPE